MKKITALLLAFIMVFALGAAVFADTELEEPGDAEASATVNVDEGWLEPLSVYSVSITWENNAAGFFVSSAYEYVWDPAKLKYTKEEAEEVVTTGNVTGSMTITITNRSNTPVNYDISGETVDGFTVERSSTDDTSGWLESADAPYWDAVYSEEDGYDMTLFDSSILTLNGSASSAGYYETYTVTDVPEYVPGTDVVCVVYTVSISSGILDTDMADEMVNVIGEAGQSLLA